DRSVPPERSRVLVAQRATRSAGECVVSERQRAGMPRAGMPRAGMPRAGMPRAGMMGDMEVVALEDVTAAARGAAVTIGAYDGVHLGHQAVLRLVRELAAARGLDAVCLTFDRHPAEVVRPESAPKLLTTLEQKTELLAAT